LLFITGIVRAQHKAGINVKVFTIIYCKTHASNLRSKKSPVLDISKDCQEQDSFNIIHAYTQSPGRLRGHLPKPGLDLISRIIGAPGNRLTVVQEQGTDAILHHNNSLNILTY